MNIALQQLLREMVADDPQFRIQAGLALWDRYVEEEAGLFGRQIREAVDMLRSKRPFFIRSLLHIIIDKQLSWEGHARRTQGDVKSWVDQMPGNSSMGLHVVFNALDHALLDAPDLLEEMLTNRVLCGRACEALHRIGPAAKAFVPLLKNNPRNGTQAHALGSIIRANSEEIKGLASWLLDADIYKVTFACIALREVGPAAEQLAHGTLETLKLIASQGFEGTYRLYQALASVGRNREDVLEFLLQRRDDSPENLHIYGSVIDNVVYFTNFPERVVPMLVAALDTFEEYDSDWTYHGDHARIAQALMPFGARAGSAVDPLVSRIFDEEGQWNKRVVQCLGNMGPVAAAALPYLEPLCDDWDDPEDYEPESCHIAAAVARLRGKPGPNDPWKLPDNQDVHSATDLAT